jgi:hypothetical protein
MSVRDRWIRRSQCALRVSVGLHGLGAARVLLSSCDASKLHHFTPAKDFGVDETLLCIE